MNLLSPGIICVTILLCAPVLAEEHLGRNGSPYSPDSPNNPYVEGLHILDDYTIPFYRSCQ